ncbi:kinase [Hirsutella rhossiliensis]|uniref:EKC/KEOPS complex subunit BUD32 n=1 Tax=Hirsutella rhossiliensis TaxID=111463 RepID=A0A9P8MRV6_9HYPO|nr:kinase [Hirsutella rhossiliensis]KAH0959339.1 kinase [Hirsutella rhossiliensis]
MQYDQKKSLPTMIDQARSSVIKDNPIGNGLDSFRTSFDSLCDGRSIDKSCQKDFKNITLDLLSALQSLRASRLLQSAASGKSLFADLLRLNAAVDSNDLDLERTKPLLNAVVRKAPDHEIWSVVLDLTASLARVTPPVSVPAAVGDTPIVHSSASQQGSEQTRELVERKVFDEIRLCTYRDVGGFFEKYFEGKEWTRSASGVYEATKHRHDGGAWTDLPNPPVQAGVLDWWFQFQDDCLSEERRRYYSTTKPKDLIGAEAKRQIDLFVKRNDGQQPDAVHDWRDVDVIGELKASNNNKKATLLQLGRYVRDVFSCQPTRRYVHAFTICGREMEVWVFDRSGCYSPGPFDIDAEPKRFIRVIAGYTMMNDEELGLDIFTEQDGDNRSILVEDVASDKADLLKLAHERGVEGIARLIGHRRITSINEMRSGLKFTKPYPFRVFRCLVISPAGRAIHKYEKKSELLGALRDAIKAHRSLYLKGNILHRDISENNIIITDPERTGHMGMLIDLDLAKELGSGRSGARCRTGTMEFMAIEVLLGISHTYRHDLESFFYVLIWQCARRGDYDDIARIKAGDMSKGEDVGFGFILREFPPEFDCVKPLCRELRGILFPILNGELFKGTPKDPDILYGPILRAFDKAIDDINAMEG